MRRTDSMLRPSRNLKAEETRYSLSSSNVIHCRRRASAAKPVVFEPPNISRTTGLPDLLFRILPVYEASLTLGNQSLAFIKNILVPLWNLQNGFRAGNVVPDGLHREKLLVLRQLINLFDYSHEKRILASRRESNSCLALRLTWSPSANRANDSHAPWSSISSDRIYMIVRIVKASTPSCFILFILSKKGLVSPC